MRRTEIRSQDEVSGLSAIALHPLDEKAGILARPESAGVNGVEAEIISQGAQLFDELRAVVDADGFPLLADEIADSLHQGRSLHDLPDLVEDIVVERRGGAPGFPFQAGCTGDHVASAAAAELADVDPGHAITMAGNTEHGRGRHASRRQGIVAGIGFESGVGRLSHEFHVKLGRTEKLGGIEHQLATCPMNADVQCQQEIHVIELTSSRQRLATAATLFCRLEEEFDTPPQSIGLGHDAFGEHQADGGMAIMATGMHPARVARAPCLLAGERVFARLFFYFHRVHVETKPQGGAGSAAVKESHHAGQLIDARQPVGVGALSQGTGLLGCCIYLATHHQ